MSRAFVILAFLFTPLPLFAASAGDLVKLADDGNPGTEADAAVYYVGGDAKRYVFPNAATFFTWYGNFAGAKDVSPDEMAALSIGGNVTYRPGVKMVKIQTDPKVYAVDRGGTLRHVMTEAVAACLYGADWNRDIDDVPDVFFGDYRLGAPVSACGEFSPEAVTAATATIADDKGLVSPPVEGGERVLEIAAAPLPAKTEVRGQDDVAAAAFVFRVGAGADAVIRSLVFQGYIDEQESAGGFLPGSDADNGSETRVGDLLPSVWLADGQGTVVAGPVPISFDGRVIFTGMGLALPAGSSGTFTLRGDLSRDAVIETHDDRLAFDIVDAARDAEAVDAAGTAIPSVGLAPNGGTSPLQYLTVREHGALTFSWSGNSGAAVAGRETPVGSFTLAAQHDAFDVTTLTFTSVGDRSEALTGLRLDFAAPDGTPVSVTATFAGNEATFHGLPLRVPRGQSVALLASAQVSAAGGASISGDRIALRFAADRAVAFASEAEGRVFGDAELRAGGAFTVPTNVTSDMIVRLSGLTVARDAATPSGPIGRGQAVEALRFSLTADPLAPARVKRLSFRIEAGDVGYEGSDNDALERWADVNGDFFDDNGVIELRRFAGASYDVLAEGSEAAIRFGIVRNAAADMTPQGLDSAYGDEGLIEIEWNDGSEPVIGAGATVVFALALKSDVFKTGEQALKVRLLGAEDFLWTDTPSGPYTAADGFEVVGLPVISPAMTVL